MYTDKNKGGLTAFIIIIISFVSWAVFTSSLMLSGEISLRTDIRDIIYIKNKESFLEVLFKETIFNIEKEISEKNIRDIIWYFTEKNGKLMWTENYEDFPLSERGYEIYKIITGKQEKYFSKENGFDFRDFIAENPDLSSIKEQEAIIFFRKIWKDICIEDFDLGGRKYNMEIDGQIKVVFPKRENTDISIMKSCKLEVLNVELY